MPLWEQFYRYMVYISLNPSCVFLSGLGVSLLDSKRKSHSLTPRSPDVIPQEYFYGSLLRGIVYREKVQM